MNHAIRWAPTLVVGLLLPACVAGTPPAMPAQPASAAVPAAGTPSPTPTPFRDGCEELGGSAAYCHNVTTVSGAVRDPDGNLLDGATITARVVSGDRFANGSDTFINTQIAGTYRINGAPGGSTIQVTASKPSYEPAQSVIAPAPPDQPTRLDFVLKPQVSPSPRP